MGVDDLITTIVTGRPFTLFEKGRHLTELNPLPSPMSIEAKLTELGLTLPAAPAAVAAYQPWIRTGNLVFTFRQFPFRDGAIAYTGKLGGELTEEDGYQAAANAP